MASLLRICAIGFVVLLGTMTPHETFATEVVGAGTSQTSPLTLKECYALALKRSEAIAIQQELLRETEGRFLQALSAALPRASFYSSDKRQDGSGGSAFTLRHIPERKFVFTQPLFSGFKEFAAIAFSRAERREREYEKARAEQLLLVDVADAFHFLLENRQDLGALETIRLALIERIEDLKAREQLGRSRPSEIASAQVQLRRIEAEQKRVQGQEVTARQLLEFLTGRPHIEAIRDEEISAPPVVQETDSLTKASGRADVHAAEEAWAQAQHEVTIARANFFPTVNLESDYYTDRVGVAQDVDWDVVLTVNAPIFQGAQAVGAVSESASRARQAKLRLDEVRRQAALDIQDASAQLQAALERTDALKHALVAAEENYRLQVEDYRHNLVNNLEVLQALQALEDARRETIHAQHEAMRLYWKLRVAAGETL